MTDIDAIESKRKKRSKFDIPPEAMQRNSDFDISPRDETIDRKSKFGVHPEAKKSKFDIRPEDIQSVNAQQGIDFLLKYSIGNSITSGLSGALKDPAFEKRLKQATEKNFNYIRRKDACIAAGMTFAPVTSVPLGFRNTHRPVVRSGLGVAKEAPKARSSPITSIYVAGLPKDMTEAELDILFSVCGELRKVKLYLDQDGSKKGDALVTFHKAEAVLVACRQYNGKDIGEGHVLAVSRAEFGGEGDSGGMGHATADKEQAPGNEGDAVSFQQGSDLHSIAMGGELTEKTGGDSVARIREALPPESLAASCPVVVLRNVYDPSDSSLDAEFFIDLEADLLEECCLMGKVRALLTPEHALLEGCVCVTFQEEAAARECASKLQNRRFDGRRLTVDIILPPSEVGLNPRGSLLEDVSCSSVTESGRVVSESADVVCAGEQATEGLDDFFNSLL